MVKGLIAEHSGIGLAGALSNGCVSHLKASCEPQNASVRSTVYAPGDRSIGPLVRRMNSSMKYRPVDSTFESTELPRWTRPAGLDCKIRPLNNRSVLGAFLGASE
ncbi:hypothetical protein PCAR4_550023 [Paraburkholderia caribensis]|nr:hypothetical protein PCAR4_550023 [Paraburkholderia caribensis]